LSTYVDKQGVLAELAKINIGFKDEGTVSKTQNPLLFNPNTARRASNAYMEGRIYLGYDHFALADTSNPNVAVNRLQFTPHTEEFLRIPNFAITSLRPLVRLYEIIAHPELSGRYLVPIPFPTVAYGATVAEGNRPGNVNSRAYEDSDGNKYGNADFGLQDVSLDFKATNPAEINNNIECKIRLYFNSITGLNQNLAVDVSSVAMIQDPNDPDGVLFDGADWNFMRLVTRGQNFTNKLKMVIGYDAVSAYKPWHAAALAHLDQRELQQFKDLYNFFANHIQVLELSLREHEIDVNENGSVVVTLSYHAGVTGELMDAKKSDIFGFYYHDTEKRWGSNKTRLEEYQESLRALRKRKNSGKKGSNSPKPSDNSSDDGPDYTREWLTTRKHSKVLDKGQKGTQDDVGKWLQRSGNDLERRERFLLRQINQMIYRQQQALGGVFWDYLIKQNKLRKIMVPLAYFERKSNADSSGRTARTEEEQCLDLLAQVPFVQLQQKNSNGRTVTQSDYERVQQSFTGPLADVNTLGGQYFDPNKDPDIDKALSQPREWSSDDNQPVASEMDDAIESEYLKRMLKSTSENLRGTKKDVFGDLDKQQKDAQEKFIDDQDPEELLRGIIDNFALKSDRVEAAFDAAWKGGTDPSTDNKNLVEIEYVFLGDILDGILGAHQLGQKVVSDETGKQRFVIDTSKSIVLNNIDMTGHGKCPDESNSTAYFSRASGGDYRFTRNKDTFKNSHDATMIKTSKTRNIADLPISIETLSKWWISNVIEPFRSEWTLGAFLGSVVTELIPAGLGLNSSRSTKLNENAAQRPQISVLEVDFGAYEARRGGFIRNLVEHKNTMMNATSTANNVLTDEDMKALAIAKPPNRYRMHQSTPAGSLEKNMISDKSATLLFLDVAPVKRSDLSADRTQDHSVGIWHFFLARDAGPILSYSFSRNEIAYLSEANIFRDGSGGIAEDASSGIAYNVTLKMLGHKLFNPGTTFYLDLIGLGFGSTRNPDSPARQLNIGGYYTVKSVKSNLSIDGFYTDVEGVWQPTVLPEE